MLRILTFEFIETLALTDSLPEAIRQWGSDKVQRNMITPDFLHSVGCAIVNCGVRTVPPAFIRRSDLGMPYRAFTRLRAFMGRTDDVDG